MENNLYILANSPGEMSGWVAPVVTQVRLHMPEARITVALIPDWFTSGRERDFGEQLPVDRVAGVFTVIRTSSDPARANSAHWRAVPITSAVSVLVID